MLPQAVAPRQGLAWGFVHLIEEKVGHRTAPPTSLCYGPAAWHHRVSSLPVVPCAKGFWSFLFCFFYILLFILFSLKKEGLTGTLDELKGLENMLKNKDYSSNCLTY